MPVETIINEKTTLQSVASACLTPGATDRTVYGLKVFSSSEILFQMDDISANEMDVLRFISLIKDKGVEIEQLPYLIEDYVTSLHM